MIVSRLFLEDFKSFGGKTSVALPAGVAVVVGRNGSGKSNLVDALRWVFGQADLDSLRARGPQDLLSRSEEQGRQAGRCRVRVSLAGQGSGSGETSIERAFDREEGERYLIDGNELSRGAYLEDLRRRGIHVPLATAVRQGDVGRLLWLHPEERTLLLTRGLGDWPEEEVGLQLRKAKAAVRQARLEVERLEGRCGDLEGELARAKRLQAMAEELAGARASLLASLAPGPQDPQLKRVLEVLRLPSPLPETADIAALTSFIQDAALHSPGAPIAVHSLEERLAAAGSQLASVRRELASLQDEEMTLAAHNEAAAALRRRRFAELHQRIESRFSGFFHTLVPGGEASLPPLPARAAGDLPGLQVAVRFPEKPAVPLDALSGGQLAVLGLCLALAAFLEVPSPLLILDEVEPALDEVLVRRLTRLLADVGRERQVLAVSHQTMMRHTAGQVMMVERKEGVSRIAMQYDPRVLRGPASPVR